MRRWVGMWAVAGVALLFLSGCVVRPGAYGYGEGTFAVAGPQVAFTFSDGVDAYYESAFGAYIYGANGYYYRWVNNGWLYATYYDGPWVPIGGSVYLPPLLAYGPPPPVVRYRPYFVWWRMHAGPWYAVHHPHWWYRHHFYLRHYGAWRTHVIRYYDNHPGRRPAMRVLFHRHEQRMDRLQQRRMMRQRQNRFYDHGPMAQRGGPLRYRRPFMGGPGPAQRFQRGPGPMQRFQGGPGPMQRFQGGPGPMQRFQGGPGPMQHFRGRPGPMRHPRGRARPRRRNHKYMRP